MPAQPELGSDIAQLAENLLWQMKRFEEAVGLFLKQLKTQMPPPPGQQQDKH